MNDLRLPCRTETKSHLDIVIEAQNQWKRLGECFVIAVKEWYFTHNPICAFQEDGSRLYQDGRLKNADPDLNNLLS